MDNKYLAIEIGGTKLQLAIGNDAGNIEERFRFEIARESGAEGIKSQIEQALKQITQRTSITAAGIGFGGPVDFRSGKISASFHIDGWNDFNLVEWVQTKIDAPVFLENDANVAALGEAIYGVGEEYDYVFYITLGSGVGGGLVRKGKIYHGAIPGESEVGHIHLDREGSTMETNCSGWAVDRKIRAAIKKEPKGILARLVGGTAKGEAKFLKAAIDQNDGLAKEILEETGKDIAFGLSHVVHLFHPEVIILGGGLSLIGEELRTIVEKSLKPLVMQSFQPGPVIKLAHLKEDSVPVGALELARQQYKQLIKKKKIED